jgi:hypothetical protein
MHEPPVLETVPDHDTRTDPHLFSPEENSRLDVIDDQADLHPPPENPGELGDVRKIDQ